MPRRAGLGGDRPHGFVDVGYSATMQTAIQTALGRPLIGLYMASPRRRRR